jgi:hypothetical protein
VKDRIRKQNHNPQLFVGMPGAEAKSHENIPHQEILQASQAVSGLPGIVDIYCQRVLTQKTRALRLLGRKSSAKIIHTLLGYELKAANKRIHCPDLATAQYLKIFTEIGCRSIKLPYDPTLTVRLIPELERGVENLNKKIRELFPLDPGLQRYAIQKAYAIVRRQLQAVQRSYGSGFQRNNIASRDNLKPDNNLD